MQRLTGRGAADENSLAAFHVKQVFASSSVNRVRNKPCARMGTWPADDGICHPCVLDGSSNHGFTWRSQYAASRSEQRGAARAPLQAALVPVPRLFHVKQRRIAARTIRGRSPPLVMNGDLPWQAATFVPSPSVAGPPPPHLESIALLVDPTPRSALHWARRVAPRSSPPHQDMSLRVTWLAIHPSCGAGCKCPPVPAARRRAVEMDCSRCECQQPG